MNMGDIAVCTEYSVMTYTHPALLLKHHLRQLMPQPHDCSINNPQGLRFVSKHIPATR